MRSTTALTLLLWFAVACTEQKPAILIDGDAVKAHIQKLASDPLNKTVANINLDGANVYGRSTGPDHRANAGTCLSGRPARSFVPSASRC